MSTVLLGLDALMVGLILLASLDYLRVNQFLERPWQCAAFFMLAIAAFGLLFERLGGVSPSAWAVLFHLSLIIYAAVHRCEIFDRDWLWTGAERRRT